MIDTEVPVKLLGISYHWALIGALAAGTLMMTFEMITYWSLREGIEAAKWYIVLGILRDIVFMVVPWRCSSGTVTAITALTRKVSQI